MTLSVLIWHQADPGAATALAHRLGEELRDDEALVSRDVSEGAILDLSVPVDGTTVHAGDPTVESDRILVIAADATPEPGVLAAFRKAPKEYEAWTGALLDPTGAAVAAAGLGLAFTGRVRPARPGLPVDRLPDTHFLSSALPGELFAVPRQTIAELGALQPAKTPAGVALDLSLRLRSSGARAGVVPAARVRLGTWQPHEADLADRIPTVVRAYPTPLLAVTSPALALAGPAAIARGIVQGDGRDAAAHYRAGISAGRMAARERSELAALRSLDSATFADGLSATGDDASAPIRVIAGAWWGVATSAMRARRARHRRQAARQ